MEKKLDSNYTRMLRAILNKSWRQHHTKQQLYGHLPLITKTIQVRRTRHARHCWRSRDELISDVLQWTQSYGRTKTGRPARAYIQQLCEDTGCNPQDQPEGRSGERGSGISVLAARRDDDDIIYIYIYIYIHWKAFSKNPNIVTNTLAISLMHQKYNYDKVIKSVWMGHKREKKPPGLMAKAIVVLKWEIHINSNVDQDKIYQRRHS